MKILCAYSGIEFSCEHFPYSLSARETTHPVFNIPQKKLLSLASKWASQSAFTPTDSYLYFLALLNSSDLIHWHCPVRKTPFTDSIVAQNMESLLRTVIKLNTVSDPTKIFPSFAITPDSATLSNVQHWLESWDEAYNDFKSGYRSAYDSKKLIQREAALARMIKNPHAPPAKIASQIADWAAIAGSFPTFPIPSPWINGLQISISDYWKTIIIRCAKNEQIFALNRKDMQELLDHCLDNIPLGSLYSSTLFTLLRKAIEKNADFLGLDSMAVPYEILDSSTDVQSANIKALINSAPIEEPLREDFPTQFKYLQAKLRYDAARRAGLRGEPNE